MDNLSDELKKISWSTKTPREVSEAIASRIKDIDNHSGCLKHGVEDCSDANAKVRDAARAKVYSKTVKILVSFLRILEVACAQDESE